MATFVFKKSFIVVLQNKKFLLDINFDFVHKKFQRRILCSYSWLLVCCLVTSVNSNSNIKANKPVHHHYHVQPHYVTKDLVWERSYVAPVVHVKRYTALFLSLISFLINRYHIHKTLYSLRIALYLITFYEITERNPLFIPLWKESSFVFPVFTGLNQVVP